ncbi:LCP family protein [Nocardioides albus]|uniref:LCP family protein required for cell wall assembly n=1 Tax=Nocardioides albus TaxID=1841 RepID=A0A7W5A0Y0_9ACTN|nr:LCP family protein [Nocardioides albus]MBB3087646.1 LCP family protein required for cell wall assembly [Nocardioides albus]
MSGFEWMYGADEAAGEESEGTRSGRGARAADVPIDQPSAEPGGGRRAARPQSDFVSPPPPAPGGSGGGRRAARPIREEPAQADPRGAQPPRPEPVRPEPPRAEPERREPVQREVPRAERYQAMGRGSSRATPTPAPPAPQEWNDPDATMVAPPLRETSRPARDVPPPPAPVPPVPAVEETAVAPAQEWYRQDPQPAPPTPKAPDQQLAPPAAREFDWNDPAATTVAPRPAPAERPQERTTSRDELHAARHEAYPAAGRRDAAYAGGYDDELYDDGSLRDGYEEPYAPYPADEREDRDRPRISVWQVLSSTLLVLALLVGLFTVYTYRDLRSNIDTVSLGEEAADVGPKEPINILVMGSDSRDCKGCNVDGKAGGGQRSDTTILLHLSANRKFAYGVSIPRDTMVDRPSCETEDGKSDSAEYVRWNEAYSAGGPACTVTQLESVANDMCGKKCDITVNHVVVVDFTSFKGMVDAIEGVDVCIPEEVDDPFTGAHFEAGDQKLTGKQALNYVRLRHGLGNGGDLHRSQRQQAFIGSMAAKLLSGDTLSSPTKVLGFLNAATKGLTMDEGLKDNLDTMAKIGVGFQSIGMENIKFLTIPVVTDPQNDNTVVLDPEKAKNVFKAIANDKPLTKKIAAGALDAGEASGKKSKKSDDAAAGDEATGEATDGETAGSAPGDESDSTESSEPASGGASSGASEDELAQIAEDAKAARESAGLC